MLRIVIPEQIDRIANSDDRKLAIRFFIFFSRFEYSLKRNGFAIGDDSHLDPDWDGFANKYQNHFISELISDDALRTAYSYFAGEPPHKQILLNGTLHWSNKEKNRPRAEGDLRWILAVVRRVRNNLFHGGKFCPPDGPFVDPSRDKNLLEASLQILATYLELDPDVTSSFMETLDE